jgi:hypothetical protein
VNEKPDEMKLDFNLLEELFLKTSHLLNSNKTMTAGSSELVRNQSIKTSTGSSSDLGSISLLDPKQNMNINVYLKKIKQPLNEFIKSIENGRSKEIGIDNLSVLKKILPDKSDVKEKENFLG